MPDPTQHGVLEMLFDINHSSDGMGPHSALISRLQFRKLLKMRSLTRVCTNVGLPSRYHGQMTNDYSWLDPT
jgi:hypothetical protein